MHCDEQSASRHHHLRTGLSVACEMVKNLMLLHAVPAQLTGCSEDGRAQPPRHLLQPAFEAAGFL